jgi:hypothetical protein
MRPIRIGLIAAVLVALAAPGAALAADKKPAAAAPSAISPDAIKKGMAAAPAVVQQAGLTCGVKAARLIGSVPADKKTGVGARDFYEVACNEGGGYVMGATKGGGVDVNSCLETMGGTTSCLLPENAGAAATLTPALAKAGIACTPEKIRGIGQTTNDSFLEVACQGGVGYILQLAKPADLSKPLKGSNCLQYDAANGQLKCTLVEPAARLAIVDRYVTEAKVTCAVKDRRYIGQFKDGAEGYEAACQDGKGYVLRVNSKGEVRADECVKSPGLCELIDARQAMSEQAALYTRLAKASGSTCEVDKYALFPTTAATQGREVLELACKDGSAVVGFFPATGKGEVLDCAHSMIAGFRCGPGKMKYDPMTADLKKLGKPDCAVSEMSVRGKTAAGISQVEVACADGLPGYLVQYSNPTTATEAVGCRLTQCTLAANKPKS